MRAWVSVLAWRWERTRNDVKKGRECVLLFCLVACLPALGLEPGNYNSSGGSGAAFYSFSLTTSNCQRLLRGFRTGQSRADRNRARPSR